MDVTIPCPCPGTPHETDTVTLRESLDFRGATTARNAVMLLQAQDDEASIAEILAVLTEQYVLLGVTGWTLVADGKPLPVSRANLRDHLLTHDEAATLVADAADELYAGAVMRPLLARARTSSPATPTTEPMFPTSGGEPPTPSSPSSISTIPTAVTGTTSPAPDGDSNSSPSSASAA
jgi:hypothetical protein